MGSIATQSPLAVPSAERCESGSFPLYTANFPSLPKPESIDAKSAAAAWVESFNKTMRNPDLAGISKLFLAESYWRDQLCLSWDFHCPQGPAKIAALLKQSGNRIKSLSLDESSVIRSPTATILDAEGKIHTVQAFLSVQTDVGSGEGIVRLVQEHGQWKVFTLFTYLKELKGHEERIGRNRPNGVEHGEHASQNNWLDRRRLEENFEGGLEPTVVIMGAGQGGLSIAARLKMLGITSLIVDRERRIGDNWRSRYHQLVLHDAVWFDHLPYLPFPDFWPVFTPKDKLGDWFESYVKLLELNAWTETTISKATWDESASKWTVTLDKTVWDEKAGKFVNVPGTTRVLHPRHIIQATGASGEPNFPSDIPGLDTFKGTLCHSSKFKGASAAKGQGKKAIVVGSCNSGHDIAQDLYENGYDVTMVQRSSTCVIGAETMKSGMSALYGEGAPSTEDADVIFHSIPNQVTKRMNIGVTAGQNKADQEILRGLESAGFTLDKGPGDSGLWIKYLQRGGGYYLDVGCSSLIAERKIRIKSGHSIIRVLPQGLEFDDGQVLEADTIVFATGYLNMKTQCRKIFGDAVADKVKDVWGFDEEGEIRTIWRKSGHKGFWFMGGNLALARWYSRMLALQIKGIEEGLAEL